MSWDTMQPGAGQPMHDNAPQTYTPGLYADIAKALSGDFSAPAATFGNRTDGIKLFYPGTVNALVGEPESGKTLMAQAALADVIYEGGSVLIIDVDHNGAAATAQRLHVTFQIPLETLTNTDRFRYAAPEDKEQLLLIVAESLLWQPTAVLVDSVGEVLPMFGANSNDADQYTAVHRQVFTALASSGAGVLLIDHVPKSRQVGDYATGTAAKKRAIDGAMYSVRLVKPFVPGQGGKAQLRILKDRHGTVRAACQVKGAGREPIAASFSLFQRSGVTDWVFEPPQDSDNYAESSLKPDVQELQRLDPAPLSIRDVKERCGWGQERAQRALNAYRQEESAQGAVPVPLLKERGTGTSETQYLEVQAGTGQVQVQARGAE